MSATVLAALGVVAVMAAWLHYLWLIPREKVPARPIAHLSVMVAGVGLGAVAEAWQPAAAVHALLAGSVGLTGFFVYLWTWAPQPPGQPTFAIGEPLPRIAATSASGEPWSSSELLGTRTLVKLFRGHW